MCYDQRIQVTAIQVTPSPSVFRCLCATFSTSFQPKYVLRFPFYSYIVTNSLSFIEKRSRKVNLGFVEIVLTRSYRQGYFSSSVVI